MPPSSTLIRVLANFLKPASAAGPIAASRSLSAWQKHPISSVGAVHLVSYRPISTMEITKNLLLFTDDKQRNVKTEPKTLKLLCPVEKPLVLVFSWLQARPKHLKKYAELYTEQGFDVVVAQITPWQLLWPVKGVQLVALDVLNFLTENGTYRPIVIHGFSVGGYMWGECMVHITQNEAKYKPLLNRICAQIWDSAADITEIPEGVPKALFPKNPTLRSALKKYMIYHLKTFHEAATQHYIRSSQMFHSTLVNAPALFFVSKTDPVGAVASNERVRDMWESKGIPITWKCWERSPHVMHFQKHRIEYIQYLLGHLQAVNMIPYPEKMRAKL